MKSSPFVPSENPVNIWFKNQCKSYKLKNIYELQLKVTSWNTSKLLGSDDETLQLSGNNPLLQNDIPIQCRLPGKKRRGEEWLVLV